MNEIKEGYKNTGNDNTGDCNTGNDNMGDRNTGNGNTGNWNTGNCNTGDYNTGNKNTGNWNTGDRNIGYSNTGKYNKGNRNVGNCNTGNYNTGDCNTGDYNTGDWNKSSFNNGCFMTEEPTIMLFNKPSTWTYRDWLESDACYLLNLIYKNSVELIKSDDMTDEEKEAHPKHETTGGYLKVLDKSECGQIWWDDDLNEYDRDIIRAIPNFDDEIFEQITGINTKKQNGGNKNE